MKKIYLGLLSFAVIGGVSAQTINAKTRNAIKNNVFQEVSAKTKIENEKAVTLWQNDFSTSSQWSFADNSGSGDNWVIGNAVPAGSFPISPIASTTAANGYALFDSDLMCSNDQNADVKVATPINLSANPVVAIQFQSQYRKFNGNCYVIASADGVTWTQFEVHSALPGNASTTNPENVQVNLSSVIGSSATAYIGFRYIGGCDYAWMVDDVKLIVPDNYDMTFNSLYWGSTGQFQARLPYYRVPVAQIQPIEFSGIVSNQGALSQPDVVGGISIPSASYNATSAAVAIAPNAFDTLAISGTFTPASAVATFAATATVSTGQTDANPADNSKALTFAVTNSLYARDGGTATGGAFNSGKEYQIGNIYDIVTASTLRAVDFYVTSTAIAGSEVRGILYNIDANGDFAFVNETPSHVITAGELGSTLTLPFSAGVPLNTEPYLVVVATFGVNGANDDLVVGTSGISEAQTSFFYDPNAATGGPWFYTTNTPMVRMNFNSSLGLNEASNEYGVSVYPNPSVNDATVSFELKNASDVAITVTDLAGKTVYSSTMNNLTTGAHQVAISTTEMASGIYTVNFTANNSVITKKLVVKK